MPIDLLLSEPLMSAPLCQALCSLLVMKQFPKRTKREKTFISRSVLALTFSRVSVEGQALLEVLGVLLGAEPSTLTEHTSPWPWRGTLLGVRNHIVATRRW